MTFSISRSRTGLSGAVRAPGGGVSTRRRILASVCAQDSVKQERTSRHEFVRAAASVPCPGRAEGRRTASASPRLRRRPCAVARERRGIDTAFEDRGCASTGGHTAVVGSSGPGERPAASLRPALAAPTSGTARRIRLALAILSLPPGAGAAERRSGSVRNGRASARSGKGRVPVGSRMPPPVG